MRVLQPMALLGAISLTVATAAGDNPLPEAELIAAAARLDAVVQRFRAKRIQNAVRWQRIDPALPPPASDESFLRRACIIVAGRLPRADEVRQFVDSTAANKRAQLMDRLAMEPGAAEARFRQLAEALRATDSVEGVSQRPFIGWLRQAAADDMPYDQLIAAMLLAQDDEAPAALLRRDGGDIMRTASELARALLGADLHCAQCHDHPFNDYMQRECYEFAACFVGAAKSPAKAATTAIASKTLFPGARPFGKRSPNPSMLVSGANDPVGLTLPPNYGYRDGKAGDPVQPRYLRLDDPPGDDPRSAFTAKPSSGLNRREQVTLWFTGPQNQRFAAVGAWRVWNHLFGSLGAVESRREGDAEMVAYHSVIDRRGCDMPPSWLPVSWNEHVFRRDAAHAEMVASLGLEFKQCGYRVREFQRIIGRTQAFQAEAAGTRYPYGPGLVDARPAVRRLPPEVLWDAWVRWLPETDEDAQPGSKLPEVPPVTHPLRLLGRGSREWADNTIPVISHSLARYVINSPLIERVAGSAKLISVASGPSGQVEHLFLAILGRFPLQREQSVALSHLESHPQTGAKDLAWALLNTTEFLFIP